MRYIRRNRSTRTRRQIKGKEVLSDPVQGLTQRLVARHGRNTMHRLSCVLNRARAFERQAAQGMVEYGMVIVLVSVAAIAGLLILGPKISDYFTTISSSV